MRMLKGIVFAILALLLVAVMANPVLPNYNSGPIEVIALEEPCVRQGGICLRYEDCDPGNLVHANTNLCPLQMHLGVTCCYM